jgi:hypothetical protein
MPRIHAARIKEADVGQSDFFVCSFPALFGGFLVV